MRFVRVLFFKPLHSLRIMLLGFGFVILFSHSSFAKSPAKQDVVAKYDEAVSLSEDLNLYQEDTFRIFPRMRQATEWIKQGQYEQADHLLSEVLLDMELVKTQKPAQAKKEFRLQWLEIYREIIQRYALIALWAYLFIRIPLFRNRAKTGRFFFQEKFYLSLFMNFSAIAFAFFDLSRYGEAAWNFLDLQVVVLAITGLLGGFWCGLASGMIIGIFRLILKPELFVYFVITCSIGILSGLFSKKMGDLQRTEKISFFAGLTAGVIHGAAIYLPMRHFLPWPFILLSVFFLALIEGVGVLIFFAIFSGFLREENRREVERELFKTQIQFLQAQISPHFIFNALSSITSSCTQEGAAQSRELVVKLSKFLRGTLRMNEDVTLEDEIAHIDAYLELEKWRFRDRFRIEKQFDILPELWAAKIPLMILQPIVENAIKHGISGKKVDAAVLRLVITADQDVLTVEISDNGAGIPDPVLQQILEGKRVSKGTGIGFQNVNQRLIRLFGRQYALGLASEMGKGTKVTVKIPIKKVNAKKREKVA